MARGDNPNSRANLVKNSDLTPKQRKERASKAGKKSGEVRRQYATFQECFKDEMDDETRKKLYDMLKGRALRGNLKAFEILRDTMGEKPVDRIEAEVYEDDGFMDAIRGVRRAVVDDTELTGEEDG